MFQTSADILYLVIAFCVLWVTVFLCWMLFYVMKILKNTNRIVEEFRTRLQSLTDTINYVRGKVEHMSSLMTLATGGVSGLVKKMVTRKASEWIDEGSERFNRTAKEAVDKAVDEATRKIRKTTNKIKK